MVPFLTRIELLKYSASLALLFLCVQSYRTRAHWRGFIWFLLILGFAVSLFAILQHFTFNGKLYWVREMRYGGMPFGPFVNRNHFAGLMELLIPPGVALLVLGGERRDQLPLVTLFTLLPIGAIFLSASRGGIMSFIAEMVFLAILAVMRGSAKRWIRRPTDCLGSGRLCWFPGWALAPRWNALQPIRDSRSGGGAASACCMEPGSIFLDHPVLGTGLGTLQEVFPRYETIYDGLIVNHSHNDYAEALAETGAVGGICFFTFLVFLFWNSWKIFDYGSTRMQEIWPITRAL